ncbi:ScbR family autoregulator-binding transcription factor [Streptomyces sp. NPDC050485]|uniref:ScbR family autoregulator-binding transcription factor n=1 Tax=Streptomyces sp. NPDC050485 TaxID=3365617 RepID=UPI0037A33D40
MVQQQRAVRTRQALIRSAAEAFERYGYVQAKLAEISARAGVSVGALHFHFENKAAVASSVESTAALRLRRAAWNAQRPEMNAVQRLTATSYALADQLRRDVVCRAGLKLSGETPREGGLDLRQEWQDFVQKVVAEASDEDLLIERVEQRGMADVIVAATTGFELLSRQDPAGVSPSLLTNFWRLLLPRVPQP